jgi:hypothetical protein
MKPNRVDRLSGPAGGHANLESGEWALQAAKCRVKNFLRLGQSANSSVLSSESTYPG